MLITNSVALDEARRAASSSGRMVAFKVPVEAVPAERAKAIKEAILAIESRTKAKRRDVTVLVLDGGV